MATFRKQKFEYSELQSQYDFVDTAPDVESDQRDQLLGALRQLNVGDRAIITLYLDDLN